MATDMQIDEANCKRLEACTEVVKAWKALGRAMKAFKLANNTYIEQLNIQLNKQRG